VSAEDLGSDVVDQRLSVGLEHSAATEVAEQRLHAIVWLGRSRTDADSTRVLRATLSRPRTRK